MSEQFCLQVKNVGKRYGGLEALADINLNVPEGARRAILGPNGAGKTTFFKILSGEIEPTSGKVIYRGQDITGYPPYRRAALGIARTFQVTTLFPNLSVLQNAILAVQGVRRSKYIPHRTVERCVDDIEHALQVLNRVGLSGREEVLVGSLSYGEQRQLEIGLGLASNPSLLLLDEPTAGLAQAEVGRIVELLHTLPKEITLLFIEHDMDVAFAVAEEVTVLSQGRIVAEGSLDEIRENKLVQEIYLGEA